MSIIRKQRIDLYTPRMPLREAKKLIEGYINIKYPTADHRARFNQIKLRLIKLGMWNQFCIEQGIDNKYKL